MSDFALQPYVESPDVRAYLALSPEQQRIVRVLIASRIGSGPVHGEGGPFHHPLRGQGLDLLAAGCTRAEVAKKLGVHYETVTRWAAQAGITPQACRRRRGALTNAGRMLRGLRAANEAKRALMEVGA